ncbi:MAG: hypothetical protein FWF81_03795 [Defluviitaleaceae bacterium]|nr:hypothetical protein [Defluviitaleaceae bacterium]
MLTFEEAQIALDDIADALPSEIFKGLNGSYVLTDETIFDNNGLCILGQYHVEPYGLGRYITVHYGSILEAYGDISPRRFRRELKNILHHELTHHLENLAGDRSLEIQDELDKRNFFAH